MIFSSYNTEDCHGPPGLAMTFFYALLCLFMAMGRFEKTKPIYSFCVLRSAKRRLKKQSQFAKFTFSLKKKGFNMCIKLFINQVIITALCISAAMSGAAIAKEAPKPKPVPQMQVIPMPYNQASFQRDSVELTRYHFGPGLNRPFLFPMVGPSGRSLTRMGHPHDPVTHSHHNSVWISHYDVNGTDFWSDGGKGRIRQKRIVKYEDSHENAFLVAENEWIDNNGNVLLIETRKVTVLPLENAEWLLTIDLEFKAANGTVTLGKTPFGMIGVRMAKTIGVNDGGGKIRNSEGAVNEKEVLWKKARWVDYSGAVTNDKIEGITLFDHPDNPNYPTYFHVRNDGWMGASLTFDGPMKITSAEPLNLRYGLYVHSDMKSSEAIETEWKRFTEISAAISRE
jgi:hypothetical protein